MLCIALYCAYPPLSLIYPVFLSSYSQLSRKTNRTSLSIVVAGCRDKMLHNVRQRVAERLPREAAQLPNLFVFAMRILS